MMQEDKIRKAVKELRLRLKNHAGEPLTQTEFGRMIGKSLNTIQRYETLVAPKGKTLAVIYSIAWWQGYTDLMDILKEAIDEDAGVPNIATIYRFHTMAIDATLSLERGKDEAALKILREMMDTCSSYISRFEDLTKAK